jgi:hypothetical protein
MLNGNLIKREGRAALFRREYFCGRTTPIVEYYIEYQNRDGKICRSHDYKLKRDAMQEFNFVKDNFYN